MSTTTKGALYGIVEWVKAEGEVKALDRLRMFSLAALLAEGISGLASVTPETPCSAETLTVIREAAAKVVGRPCPK